MPPYYVHRQVSKPVIGSFAVLLGLALGLGLWVQPPLPAWIIGAGVLALMAVVHALFVSLTVTVSAQEVDCYFGPGVFRWRIPRADVTAAAASRISPLHGLGLKWLPGRWLYIASPGPAVELRLRTGSAVHLSTDDQEGLLHALAVPA
ncbi:MAG: hypothetical protein IT538_01655 [Variibacter sp.]|nr:hypothetical protein [Variibacter sp.]